MAWTAEQKRARRAELAAARAAEDAARAITRRPPGGTPAGRHWDERAHAFVLDVPKPTSMAAVPMDLIAWAKAHPPPLRAQFQSQALFDDAREPWFATFIGKPLPATNDSLERSTAWSAAKERHGNLLYGHAQREERERKRQELQEHRERERREQQEQRDMERFERVMNPRAYAAKSDPSTTRVHVQYDARRMKYSTRTFIFQPRYGITKRAIEAIKKCALGDDDVCSFDTSEGLAFKVKVHSAEQAESMHAALREIDSALPACLNFDDPWWIIAKKWTVSESEAKALQKRGQERGGAGTHGPWLIDW